MKFKNKIWLIPFVLTILVGLFGWWAQHQVQQSIQTKLATDMTNTLSGNIKSLGIWMESQQKTAAVFASDGKLRELVTELAAEHRSRGQGGGRPGGGRRGGPGPFVDGSQPPDRTTGARSETNRPSGFRPERLRMIGPDGPGPGGGPGGGRGGGGQGRSPGGPGGVSSPLQLELEKYLTTKIGSVGGYASFIVLDKDGWPLASQRKFWMDAQIPPWMLHRLTNLFDEGQAQLLLPSFRPMRPSDSETTNLQVSAGTPNLPIMAITSPVRDTNNVVVAALALVIRPEEDFTDILKVSWSGESGETYAFNRLGAMISKSRFDEQLRNIGLLSKDTNLTSVLNVELRDPGVDLTRGGKPLKKRAEQPLTRIATNAVAGISGVEVESMADYRGVSVVGAWHWLPEFGIGIATQMDAAEAYRPLRMQQRIFTTLLVLLMLCTGALLGFTYANGKLRRRTLQLELEARELGQYTLERKIGEGGMGSVYLARHALLRRPTAVKLVVPELAGAGSLAMFEQEVQLTSELTHPNTIQIYDYGHTPDGIFYYAMEYLDGVTLRTLVAENGPQPEGRIIHILKQVCGSLQEAHAAGLVHRDIKPANIFLTQRSGVSDMVKVLDFGLVKRIKASEQAEPHDRRFAGTPLYMSPESIEHPETADARSDIYSLGALAYQMLTGTEVFGGGTIEEMCKHHVSSIPQPPSERLGRACDAGLESIILRCLAKNPADRPQSAAQLYLELDACEMAGTWSEDMARNWWNQARQQSRASEHPPTPMPNGSPSQTLQIDLQERV